MSRQQSIIVKPKSRSICKGDLQLLTKSKDHKTHYYVITICYDIFHIVSMSILQLVLLFPIGALKPEILAFKVKRAFFGTPCTYVYNFLNINCFCQTSEVYRVRMYWVYPLLHPQQNTKGIFCWWMFCHASQKFSLKLRLRVRHPGSRQSLLSPSSCEANIWLGPWQSISLRWIRIISTKWDKNG